MGRMDSILFIFNNFRNSSIFYISIINRFMVPWCVIILAWCYIINKKKEQMKKIISTLTGGTILLCIFTALYAPKTNTVKTKATQKQAEVIQQVVLVQPKPIQTQVVTVRPVIETVEKTAWQEMKELVKHYEGFYPKPYSCPAGFKTIGYGFTDKKLVCRSTIDKKESSLILENKLRKIEAQVDEIVDVKLTPYQKCALVSFTYNCDVDNLEKLVSGPGRLNDGNYSSVKRLLMQYTKGGGKTLKGLVARRYSEVRLWEKG